MTSFEKGFIKQANSQGISEVEALRLMKEAALFGDNWFGHGVSALGGTVSDLWKRTGQSFGQHYNNSVDYEAGRKADKLFGQYKNYADPSSFGGWQKFRSWMGHDYSRDAELAKQQMAEQVQRLHKPEVINNYNQQLNSFDTGMQSKLDASSRFRDIHEEARNRAAQIGNRAVPHMKNIQSTEYPMLAPATLPKPSIGLTGGRSPYQLRQF